jgi:hypothetical protein
MLGAAATAPMVALEPEGFPNGIVALLMPSNALGDQIDALVNRVSELSGFLDGEPLICTNHEY